MDYYNIYAEEFAESTFNVDMESLYQPFLEHLPNAAKILDLGCGSGRDSFAFKKQGYEVEASDYAEELVIKAHELTGINVRHRSFMIWTKLSVMMVFGLVHHCYTVSEIVWLKCFKKCFVH